MVTGLLLGAFFYDEKYIKKAKEIFAPGGLSSMIIFKGATFKKKEDKKPRKYIYVGSMKVDIT